MLKKAGDLMLLATALLCLFWLFPWSQRVFGAVVRPRGPEVEFPGGRVNHDRLAGAVAVPALDKTLIWCRGDERTHWDYFLPPEENRFLEKRFYSGMTLKLTGTVAGEHAMSGIGVEAPTFSLDSKKIAARAFRIRLFYWLFWAAMAAGYLLRLARLVAARRAAARG